MLRTGVSLVVGMVIIVAVVLFGTFGCVKVQPASVDFRPKYGENIRIVADENTTITADKSILRLGIDKHLLTRLQSNLERVSDRQSPNIYHVKNVNLTASRETESKDWRLLKFVFSILPPLSPVPDHVTYHYTAEYTIVDHSGQEVGRGTVTKDNNTSYSGWTFFRVTYAKRAHLAALTTASHQIADQIANDIIRQPDFSAVATARP